MSVATALLLEQPANACLAIGAEPDVLADIYNDDTHLAVWRRQLTATLDKECQNLLQDRGFNGCRLSIARSNLARLNELLPELSRYPSVCADIQLLAEMFCCLFESDGVGLRLTPLRSSMCPKFHVDHVPCRLVTAYCGAGTEWLPPHCVDRSKLGPGSAGLSDDKSGLYPSLRAIEQLHAGDVALLKGELWEGNEGAGLVHRSPAVEAGQQRLLLTFDFV